MDLSRLTRKELAKLKTDVEKALKQAEARELRAARKAAENAAAEFGYSLDQLTGEKPAQKRQRRKAARKAKAPRKTGVAKFANPEHPAQTWTGKGRQPGWFKAAIEAGKTPDDLAI